MRSKEQRADAREQLEALEHPHGRLASRAHEVLVALALGAVHPRAAVTEEVHVDVADEVDEDVVPEDCEEDGVVDGVRVAL